MVGIISQYLKGQQLAQQDAIARMKMAQQAQMFPIEQKLKQLQIEREQQATETGKSTQAANQFKLKTAQQEAAANIAKKALRVPGLVDNPELLETFVTGAMQQLGISGAFVPSKVTKESLQNLAGLAGTDVETIGGVQKLVIDGKVVPAVTIKDSAGNVRTVPTQLPEGSALVNVTPEKQAELDVDEAIKIEKGKQEAKKEAAAAIAAETKRGAAEETRRQEILDQGFKAKGILPTIGKLKQILPKIKTGGIQSAKKAFTDFFGTTPADIGQFDALAKSLVLQNLKALGSNPTEGERAFILTTTASLSQGGEVNKAILDQMEEIAKKQMIEGRFVSAGGNPLDLLGSGSPTQTAPTEGGRLTQSTEELIKMRDELRAKGAK